MTGEKTSEWKRVLHNHNFAVLPFRMEMYKTAAICVLILGREILAEANIIVAFRM
jgi:hypothetical protein